MSWEEFPSVSRLSRTSSGASSSVRSEYFDCLDFSAASKGTQRIIALEQENNDAEYVQDDSEAFFAYNKQASFNTFHHRRHQLEANHQQVLQQHHKQHQHQQQSRPSSSLTTIHNQGAGRQQAVVPDDEEDEFEYKPPWERPSKAMYLVHEVTKKSAGSSQCTPSLYLIEMLKREVKIDKNSRLFPGIHVAKVTKDGKKYLERIITISRDRLALFCTHHKVAKKSARKAARSLRTDEDASMRQEIRETQIGGKYAGASFGEIYENVIKEPLLQKCSCYSLTGKTKIAAHRSRISEGVVAGENNNVRYLDIADINDVFHGVVATQKLESSRDKNRLEGKNSTIDYRRKSIVSIYHHGKETFNFLVPSEKDRKDLISCLKQMKEKYQTAVKWIDHEALLVRYIWYDIDVNKDKLINPTEFMNLLNRINFSIKNATKEYEDFKRTRKLPKHMGITFQECMVLLQSLKRRYISKSSDNNFQQQQQQHHHHKNNHNNEARKKHPPDEIWDQLFGIEKYRVSVHDFHKKFIQDIQGDMTMTKGDVSELFTTLNLMEVPFDGTCTTKGTTRTSHIAVNETNKFLGSYINRSRFEVYLKSEMNDAYDPLSQQFNPTTMDRPLSEYWINTSHNTYLVADQLVSQSSVEMYMQALRRGSRCIELDCWDGEKGVEPTLKHIPIVFHGHTLTSKILFADIIDGIKAFLDDNPKTYPIILSIENHCTRPYQKEMVRILRTTLGDALYIPAPYQVESYEHELPSPRQLRGKVIVKTKKPPEPDLTDESTATKITATSFESNNDNDNNNNATVNHMNNNNINNSIKNFVAETRLSNLSQENRARNFVMEDFSSLELYKSFENLGEIIINNHEDSKKNGKKTLKMFTRSQSTAKTKNHVKVSSSNQKDNNATLVKKESAPQSSKNNLESERSNAILMSTIGSVFPQESRTLSLLSSATANVRGMIDSQFKTPVTIAELANITLLNGTKYGAFSDSLRQPAAYMHSFNESKIGKIIEKGPEEIALWRQYNARHLSRTYPAGVRVDSSNYNPIFAWNVGCQMVALNTQTSDSPMIINDGMFRQNGNSGYVLIPRSIFGKKTFAPPVTLSLCILSGSCLPKPMGSRYGEHISPYVTVVVHDVHEKKLPETPSSRQVKSNGSKGISSFDDNNKSNGSVTSMEEYTFSFCSTGHVSGNGFCPVWNMMSKTDISNKDDDSYPKKKSSFGDSKSSNGSKSGNKVQFASPPVHKKKLQHSEHATEFTIHTPDVAVIEFTVRENDVTRQDMKVAYAAIPFRCLRKGYRSIQLYDENNTRTGPFAFASLLVEIQF